MITISVGNEDVNKLLGKQKIEKSNYRLMKYLLRTTCEDGVLLNNTISGKLVLLSYDEANELDRYYFVHSDFINSLIEDYFLVPEDFDEKRYVVYLRRVFLLLQKNKGINGYMILPTTDCNARCAYCFEKGIRRIVMSSLIAEEVVDYIVTHKGEGHVELHWFGGEPLLGETRIDQICNGLKKFNINYLSVMTSNGFLFDDELIKKAKTFWHLKKVQITLDGTESHYNAIKNYVNSNENPFQRVINNIICLLAQNIRVTLRLNVDEYNQEDIKILVTYICEKFKGLNGIKIYASMVLKDRYDAPSYDCEENRRLLYKSVFAINQTLYDKGMIAGNKNLLSLKYHACMADDCRSVIIHPDGRLSRCQHIQEEDSYGELDSVVVDNNKIVKFREQLILEQCESCSIFPACIELVACPATANVSAYVCKKTIERERAILLQHYRIFKNENS